ncbi:uncharacterized protein LAESUDRAFT_444402 [Laetiporus sulphureus 93-53]|uniref:Uncharacterized protein n=1 Tax=Laetiporus sulphureus 93-53 TaxID=1314785 RepID=A0A165C0I1_9APHY|nr:uncharacterized protein LAESUDRAFT_444402 [Laetiporus sulphureus 93-53]KZT01977.1 hypothetical protein LAESUDRAFT_444402 [Laetiporus sulphureus 93-53]
MAFMPSSSGSIFVFSLPSVNRLIKASKQTKPMRDSVLSTSGSASSLNFVKPEVTMGPKMNAAQTELQACEAHLAQKEHELEHLRVTAICSGLQARCKAMVECGWAWGEMGKEGLRALDGMRAPNGNGNALHVLPPTHSSPAQNSDTGHAPSDFSSLAPSQSASQIGLPPIPVAHTEPDSSWHDQPPTPPKPYALQIPAAHLIPDMPNGMPTSRSPIPEVEEEEEEGGGSSESEEDLGPVEVHENARFAKKRKGRMTSMIPEPRSALEPHAMRDSVDSARHVHFPAPAPSYDSPSSNKKERTRSGSSFFGSIASLFHHRDRDRDRSGASVDEHDSPVSSRPASRWSTRTDKYLSKAMRGGDSSDEEGDEAHVQQYYTWSPTYEAPQAPRSALTASTSEMGIRATQQSKNKSTKRKPVRNTVADADRGWVSDGAATFGASANVRRTASVTRKPESGKAAQPKMNGDANPAALGRSDSVSARTRKPSLPGTTQVILGDASVTVSRSSSLSKSQLSTASAPARGHARNPPLEQHQQGLNRARTTSAHTPNPTSQQAKDHRRFSSVSTVHRSGLTRNNDGPSLMSIVEGVAKQNKDAWAKQDPNRMLMPVKAPPPIHISQDYNQPQQPAANVSVPRDAGLSRNNSISKSPAAASPLETLSDVPASASAPSLPVSANKPPEKMPLRSALRNSRTPSPNPPSTSAGPSLSAAPDTAVPVTNGSKLRNGSRSLLAPSPAEDDATSISSYETINEVFYDAESDPQPEPELDPSLAPPTPPPSDTKPEPAKGGDLSRSVSSSSTTGTGPIRRKSVRMSLPPTFSTTPPVFDDDDDDAETTRGRHHPWPLNGDASSGRQGGWSSRVQERDLWQDSSDDDEEYLRAKRLLSRMSKI